MWVQQQNALEMIILLYFQELKETEGIIFSDPSFKQIKHQKMHAESTSPQSLWASTTKKVPRNIQIGG